MERSGQAGIERRLEVRAVCFFNPLPRRKSQRGGEKRSMLDRCDLWMILSDEVESRSRQKAEKSESSQGLERVITGFDETTSRVCVW